MALMVEGKRNAAIAAHADRAWLAWTTAALQRAKKMPTLDSVTGKRRQPRRRTIQTPDQMLTMARMWSAAAGPLQGDEQ